MGIKDQQEITAYDLYKDAKHSNGASISNNTNIFDNIKYITSKTYSMLEDIKTPYNKIKDKDFYSNLQKNVVIKTPIKSLKIPETTDTVKAKTKDTLTELKTVAKCKEAIKKEKPKFLTGQMNFFHDAGSFPESFCENEKHLTEFPKYFETIASYIDPGPRKDSNTFIDTTTDSINPPDILYQCGIGNTGTEIKYQSIPEDKEFCKIIITFEPFNLKDINTIILEGKINRGGEFKEISVKVNGVTSLILNHADREALEKLFKGNNKKNEYINSIGNNPDPIKKIIATLYYLCKELGDTYQAIILKMIINHLETTPPAVSPLKGFKVENGIKSSSSTPLDDLKKDNCCLSTNDSVLFLRSKSDEINIPVLLYNDGCVRYYSPLSKPEIIKKILIDEINSAVYENISTIDFLENITEDTKFKPGASDNKIQLNLGLETECYDINGYKTRIPCRAFLQDMIINVKSVNVFLNALKKYIDSVISRPQPLHNPPSTINDQLQKVQAANIDSINKTYETICSQLRTLLVNGNLNTSIMQSIKNNIIAFKSLLTVTRSGDRKIIYQTKSIFPAISVLEPDNELRIIMKRSSFYQATLDTNPLLRLTSFKDWLHAKQKRSGGGIVGILKAKKDRLRSKSEYDNFIFFYENLFTYINCFPQLLYCFNDKEYLIEFIESHLLNLEDLPENFEKKLELHILENQKDNPDNPDTIIDNFLDNIELISKNFNTEKLSEKEISYESFIKNNTIKKTKNTKNTKNTKKLTNILGNFINPNTFKVLRRRRVKSPSRGSNPKISYNYQNDSHRPPDKSSSKVSQLKITKAPGIAKSKSKSIKSSSTRTLRSPRNPRNSISSKIVKIKIN